MNELSNNCLFTGRLGQDPEMRYLPSGVAVVNVSLAVDDLRKNKDTGKYDRNTTWVKLQAFGKLAERINDFLGKGSLVSFSSQFAPNTYQDKEGHKQYSYNFTIRDFKVLAGGKSRQQEEQDAESYDTHDDVPF